MSNKFVQTDFTSQTGTVYKTSIDDNFAVHNRIAGAFAPRAQDTPGMTIKLEAGFIPKMDAVATEVVAQNTGTITAPSSNPRKDIVYIDKDSGTVGIATGAEASSPSDPAVPADKIAVARITLATSTTTITNSLIDDVRNLQLVGSTVAAFDDSSIRSDILKLALHQAIDGNRVAYNLEDSFIDGFEDDTGITTETTVDRDTTSEYVASIYAADVVTTPSAGDWTGDTGSYTITSGGADSTAGDDAIKSNWTSGTGDFTIQLTVTAYSNQTFGVYPVSEDGSFTSDSYGGMSGMTNSWWWTGNSSAQAAKAQYGTYNGNTSLFSDGDVIEDGSVVQIKRVSGTISILIDGTSRHTYSQTSSADLRFVIAHHGTTNGNVQSMTFTAPSTTTNATGTLISDPQTASTSRTSASGVIIYSDAAGTNTLGSDLKIYFTANNGTNWTEASSYGTATTYSGTKKLVKLGATTVTAGTQVAMKAEWANQATSTDGQIAGGTGTAIGTMTGGGGLSALFDGNTAQSDTAGGRGPGSGVGWVGKSWGSVKTIAKVIVYPWSSGYFGGNNPSNMTITIEGSTDAAFTSPVVLETKTGLTGTTAGTQTFTSLVTTTGYAHHRVRFSNGIGTATISEVEFFETPVTGKEARLEGWAVNY